ncbi:hypothetical protein Tco_0091043 [Tanacetum coccineum]
MPTEMELTLEQTQQGVSYEVSVNSSVFIHNEDGYPALSQLQTAHGRLIKMVVEGPGSSCLTRSITTCSYPTDKHKVIMKAQVHVSRLPLL